MNTKAILLATVSLVSVASAQDASIPVDITGSTAGRSAVHAAIQAVLSGETTVYDGSTASGSARVIYKGTFNSKTYTIRTSWSGSVNGVRDVIQGLTTNTFFDPADTDVTTAQGTTAAATSAGQSLASTGNVLGNAPEIGYSDVFQTSTPFTGLTVEDEVGIIPFKWFKNDGAPVGLNNMTPSLARSLYGALGEQPLMLWTGNSADTSVVYATGRNADSGSRITTMAECGHGVFPPVEQYTGTVASDEITLSGGSSNSGFSSGSGVAALLAAKAPGSSFSMVGYLGSSDWGTASAGGATELAWNGVTLGTAAGWEDKIRNGQYTFWGYLHMNRMALTGDALAFYNALRDQLKSNPGSSLVKDDAAMLVERAGDGSPVAPK